MKLVQKWFYRLLFIFPRPLPCLGMTDFDRFCDDIFNVYDLPSLPSYRQAIASMVMHLSPTTAYKSPMYFAFAVKKAMANQLAYEKIQQLKKEEAEYLAKTEFKEDPKGE